jgi:hypothetical protein
MAVNKNLERHEQCGKLCKNTYKPPNKSLLSGNTK